MAKTKVLISCAVTAQLICAFVFAYAMRWFSRDVAQLFCAVLQVTAYRQTTFPQHIHNRVFILITVQTKIEITLGKHAHVIYRFFLSCEN